MLRPLNQLRHAVLEAMDGEVGRCKDFLFDDVHWTLRYMVADTGKWLPGRRVLISPISLGIPDWDNNHFPVKLSKAQIEHSPPLETDMPVSRIYEISWFDYYQWPHYWLGPGAWGDAPTPRQLYEQQNKQKAVQVDPEEIHLRSEKEVRKYDINATDGSIGYVKDFLTDDETWTIRYLIVDTRKWLPGRDVLVSPLWVKSIDWKKKQLHLDMRREKIKNSPEYDPDRPVSRDFEVALFHHYGVPPYWRH